ncbi:actin binding Rho activating protein b [Conger conger]|uniref:actin binding Rho activating protein b n=1 Tax=Conger conger TaxID=82655 RepID=UPI002A59D17D|nr:actin binding Rho activating protein b [Conger conger]
MSELQTSMMVKKLSVNKNIKKLRKVSLVCRLANSWQHWISENKEKQASEPSGWTPESDKHVSRGQGRAGPSEKRARPSQSTTATTSAPTSTTSPPLEPIAKIPEDENVPEESTIKSKQVVTSVPSSVQEKERGVGLLSNHYSKDADEVDRILNEKSSPTRRKKCQNLVSELTKSWKDVEEQQKATQDLEGQGAQGVNTDDSGFSEENSLETGAASATPVQTENPDQERLKESSRDTVDQMSEPECPARIKRPSTTRINKDIDEVKKISVLSKKYSPVGNLKNKWQNWASDHAITQKLNPFSDDFDYGFSMSTRLQKGQEGYGRPKEGTKTAERARRAEAHIHREIDDMCFIIRTMNDPDQDGQTRVTFGELFDTYVRISDKVVGILMRARKHGKVAFEGEMLWQGQDDHVIITLLV